MFTIWVKVTFAILANVVVVKCIFENDTLLVLISAAFYIQISFDI